jgi:hypothetical protein
MMGMELVPEMSILNKLTQLIAQDFINVSRCESFKSYIASSHLKFKYPEKIG